MQQGGLSSLFPTQNLSSQHNQQKLSIPTARESPLDSEWHEPAQERHRDVLCLFWPMHSGPQIFVYRGLTGRLIILRLIDVDALQGFSRFVDPVPHEKCAVPRALGFQVVQVLQLLQFVRMLDIVCINQTENHEVWRGVVTSTRESTAKKPKKHKPHMEGGDLAPLQLFRFPSCSHHCSFSTCASCSNSMASSIAAPRQPVRQRPSPSPLRPLPLARFKNNVRLFPHFSVVGALPESLRPG